MSDKESDNPFAQSSPLKGSMASTFRGRDTAKSAEELKKSRESRAADAIKMKDEQLRILSDQNSNLLQSLDKVTMRRAVTLFCLIEEFHCRLRMKQILYKWKNLR